MAVLVELTHNKSTTKLFKAIVAQKKEFSFSVFNKLLRKKDIKVNGVRVCQNIDVNFGDVISIFLSSSKSIKHYSIVYQDDNILVADKPSGIEVVNFSDSDFLHNLQIQCNCNLFPVHRLDRNTSGLVVFAKNKSSEKDLLIAFKNRLIRKFYLARVFGFMEKKQALLTAFFKKDEVSMRAVISDVPAPGFVKIQTFYRVVHEYAKSELMPIRTSLLEVELITGKMHQIRAHLAHIGHPVVGDGKYASNVDNIKMKQKKQVLCAYKIVFNFEALSSLSYLNGLTLAVDREI